MCVCINYNICNIYEDTSYRSFNRKKVKAEKSNRNFYGPGLETCNINPFCSANTLQH